jgi:transcriptional regulator with XRE-family HTH domain
MADGWHPLGSQSPQALRLRKLRETYELNQADFAEFIGVTYTRWNNFERGYNLSRAVADLIRDKIPGITAEWLDEGDPGRLPLEWARKLGEIPMPSEPNDPPPRRARAR